MKIAIINSVPYGSTGKIAYEIANTAADEGDGVEIFYGYSGHPLVRLRTAIPLPRQKRQSNTHASVGYDRLDRMLFIFLYIENFEKTEKIPTGYYSSAQFAWMVHKSAAAF